jgi:MFS family permease
MDFYLAGGVGMGAGFVLRSYFFSRSQLKRPSPAKRRLEIIVIVVGVSGWILSPLVFALLVDLLAALGVGPETVLWAGWVICEALTFVLGFGLGWVVGDDKTPRVPISKPFADGSDDPFGVGDSTSQEENFRFLDEPGTSGGRAEAEPLNNLEDQQPKPST